MYSHLFLEIKMSKLIIVSDVDGVLTDGSFYYDSTGKCMKKFGRDDADALKIMKKYIPDAEVHFCSSDFHGFSISEKRITDMGYKIDPVSVKDRPDWIDENFRGEGKTDNFVVYIGDSFVDIPVYRKADFSCCVNNGHYLAQAEASYVSEMNGGDGGFADCVLEVVSKFTNKSKEELMYEYIS